MKKYLISVTIVLLIILSVVIPFGHESKIESKTTIDPSTADKQKNIQVQSRSGPAIFFYYEWQDKFYLFDNFLNEDYIGKFLGKYDNKFFYEIKDVDPTKSIAIKYVLDSYFKADFVFNNTITWRGNNYEINPNNTEKKGKLIGKIDSFEIYTIEGVDTTQAITLYTGNRYVIAVRK